MINNTQVQSLTSDLTVLLPAYNEEKTIGLVIDEIRSLPVKCDIVVLDGYSTDDTYNIAAWKGVPILTGPKKGKGNAIRFGFKLVTTPYIIMLDSDYTYPILYICEVYRNLKMGYDVVIGYRKWKEKGSMTLTNKFGNWCLSTIASIVHRKKVYDVCSGMWGFKRGVLDTFTLESEGFTLEAELFINAVKNECNIGQIPIIYRARLEGSSPKLKLSDGFKIGWTLIK